MSKTVWTVTYQDNQVEALEAEQVKVFEDRQAARFYALEMARKYDYICLLYTSPSPRDLSTSRMPSSA